MLRLLKSGKVSGVVIHKIDRSARNLRDWADLGELIDNGIEVHFANEGLDLRSRGGRLSADIQAVVAADYIRNLREETRKGFYGRLKQGLYPLPAPVGYLDQGAGKPKVLDPAKAPLVRLAFELYATGKYTLRVLTEELSRRGFRSRNGKALRITTLSIILNNPFYMGLIHVRRTNETFAGTHEPLVSKALFDAVQRVLRGKLAVRAIGHEFLFRRMLKCSKCEHSLVGELQKGRVYYRCHTRECGTVSVREDRLDAAMAELLRPLDFSADEKRYLEGELAAMRVNWLENQQERTNSLRLHASKLEARLQRLVDAYLDGALDKDLFERRKNLLLREQADLKDALHESESNPEAGLSRLDDILELAGSAYLQYKMGDPAQKRDLVNRVTSNRTIDQKNLVFSLSNLYEAVAKRNFVRWGGPYRDIPRTQIAHRHRKGVVHDNDVPRVWDRLLPIVLKLLADDETKQARSLGKTSVTLSE